MLLCPFMRRDYLLHCLSEEKTPCFSFTFSFSLRRGDLFMFSEKRILFFEMRRLSAFLREEMIFCSFMRREDPLQFVHLLLLTEKRSYLLWKENTFCFSLRRDDFLFFSEKIWFSDPLWEGKTFFILWKVKVICSSIRREEPLPCINLLLFSEKRRPSAIYPPSALHWEKVLSSVKIENLLIFSEKRRHSPFLWEEMIFCFVNLQLFCEKRRPSCLLKKEKTFWSSLKRDDFPIFSKKRWFSASHKKKTFILLKDKTICSSVIRNDLRWELWWPSALLLKRKTCCLSMNKRRTSVFLLRECFHVSYELKRKPLDVVRLKHGKTLWFAKRSKPLITIF